MHTRFRPVLAAALVIACRLILGAQSPPAPAAGLVHRHADGHAVPDRPGRGAGRRRASRGCRATAACTTSWSPTRRRDRADGRPHRSQVARRHELHRRRWAVDHRARAGPATRRRSSTCAATAPTGRANRPTPRSCRTAPIRRCSRSPSTAARRSGSGAGSGPCRRRSGQRVAWVSRGQIWSVDLADRPTSRRNW